MHEYGGGAAIVYGNIAYFSHYGDGRVYSVDVKTDGATPEVVTPGTGTTQPSSNQPAINLGFVFIDSNNLHRFADFDVHPKISGLVVAIMEDHTNDPTGEAPSQVVNTLCVIDTATKSVRPLVSGANFYSNARFSPDGTRLVWLQWFHPDMPWEGSELKHADVAITEGKVSLTKIITIGGVPSKISVAFPSWVNNDTLLFTSDQSGYQNPHKYVGGQATPVFLEPIAQDFSQPAWTLGWTPYAPIDETGQNILCTAWKDGKTVIYLVDIQNGAPPQLVDSSFVAIDIIRVVSTESHQAVFSSPKADTDNAIILCTLPPSLDPKDAEFTAVAPAEGTPVEFPDGIISIPQPLDIGPPDALVHVVYYPPNNPAYSGSSIPDESPPCVVNVHGGPTALENQALNWKKQYFTSRGWAWCVVPIRSVMRFHNFVHRLDVNYGGSSGYGREYMCVVSPPV